MTLNRGTPAPANAANAPLQFKCPMGTVKVYDVRRKVFKTKAGDVEKTQIHYDLNGARYAFASNRADFVADMAELAKLMTKPDGKMTSIQASFVWPKGGVLSVTVPK